MFNYVKDSSAMDQEIDCHLSVISDADGISDAIRTSIAKRELKRPEILHRKRSYPVLHIDGTANFYKLAQTNFRIFSQTTRRFSTWVDNN